MKAKRLLVLFALMILIVSGLAATEVAITWEWLLADPEVHYFRYQVGGEDPTKWTVVTSEVTSYEAIGLDGTKSYTLFLQQSYDGLYWSASASATSVALVPENPVIDEPLVEEVVVEEEVIVEEEPVAVEEVVVVEEPVVVEEVVIEPITGSIVVEGIPFSYSFVPGLLTVNYPTAVKDAEVLDFINFTAERNSRFLAGVYYELKGNGVAEITIPEAASAEDVYAVGSLVIADFKVYMAALLAPVAEEVVVVQPVVEEAPVAVAVVEEAPVTIIEEPAVVEEEIVKEVSVEVVTKERAPYNTVVKLGLGLSNKNFKSFDGVLGLGLSFENIFSINEKVGLGLDVDLALRVENTVGMKSLITDVKKLFSPSSYVKSASADLLFVANINSNKLSTSLGLGLRTLVASNDNTHFKSLSLLGKNIPIDLGVIGKVGLRYNFNSAFGVGLDAAYIYMLPLGNSVSSQNIEAKGYLSISF